MRARARCCLCPLLPWRGVEGHRYMTTRAGVCNDLTGQVQLWDIAEARAAT